MSQPEPIQRGPHQPEPTAAELVRWAESLAAIAQTGLGFSKVPFERERYEEILHVAADMRARAADPNSRSAEDHHASWLKHVGEGIAGYVTPKVAVGAVVGNDRGQVLLIQRADSGIWLYPTGWADIGYSAAEVAQKEVLEETGIHCEAIAPIAILDGMRLGFTTIPMYSLVFHCRATGGEISPHPQECLDAGWFSPDTLPEPLASHGNWTDLAFAAITGSPLDVHFDVPRDEVWRTGH